MTNPLRGQIQLSKGSKTYKCRLTVDSMIKIETELDTGILAITQKLSEADIRVNDLTVILLHALRGGGNDFQEKQIHGIISEAGLGGSCTAVAELLTQTLSDPNAEEEEKKEEAAA